MLECKVEPLESIIKIEREEVAANENHWQEISRRQAGMWVDFWIFIHVCWFLKEK